MPPILPIEVVEWIMDLTKEDYWWMYDVKSCALVCRAWVPHAQHLIFRQLSFGPMDEDPGPEAEYCQARKNFAGAPHLCRHVRRVNVRELYCGIQPEHALFLTILAPCFPSLRTLFIQRGGPCIPISRIFRAPQRKAFDITTLKISEWEVMGSSSLCDTLSLFPNLRTLILQGVYWLEPVKLPDGSRKPIKPPTPRKISLLPSISHLEVAMETSRPVRWMSSDTLRVQVEGLKSLFSIIATKSTYLKINLGMFHYFTRPGLYPDSPWPIVCDFPNLQAFDIYLRGPRHRSQEESYATRIARIPQFLRTLLAKKLRVITIRFSEFEMLDWETKLPDNLAVLNPGLEELVDQSHFPSLERIRLDIYSSLAGDAGCKQCFAEIFPRLSEAGLIENLVCYPDCTDGGPFTDAMRMDISSEERMRQPRT